MVRGNTIVTIRYFASDRILKETTIRKMPPIKAKRPINHTSIMADTRGLIIKRIPKRADRAPPRVMDHSFDKALRNLIPVIILQTPEIRAINATR